MDVTLSQSNFSSMSRAALQICLVAFLAIFVSQAAKAVNPEQFDISNDGEMDRRFDWTITVKTSIDNAALNYPTSTLKPMSKLSADYRLTPRLSPDGTARPTRYEDLYYHEGKPIGCRLFNRLNIPANYQGAIRIVPSKDASESTAAIANAISRLCLDIGVRKAVLTVVFIPADIFSDVKDSLTQFNFYPTQGGPIPLFLFSDPYGQRANLYYRGS
jgi:hypothetical protein